MPAWPATLPKPLVERYEIAPHEPVARTASDLPGKTQARRRFTAWPSRVAVSWRFNRGQMAVFEAWHKLDLLDGQAAFDVDLEHADQVESYSVKFAAMWKAALMAGLRWKVSAELEIQGKL